MGSPYLLLADVERIAERVWGKQRNASLSSRMHAEQAIRRVLQGEPEEVSAGLAERIRAAAREVLGGAEAPRGE